MFYERTSARVQRFIEARLKKRHLLDGQFRGTCLGQRGQMFFSFSKPNLTTLTTHFEFFLGLALPPFSCKKKERQRHSKLIA